MTAARHDAIDIEVREPDSEGPNMHASNWMWKLDRLLLKFLVFGSALLVGASGAS